MVKPRFKAASLKAQLYECHWLLGSRAIHVFHDLDGKQMVKE